MERGLPHTSLTGSPLVGWLTHLGLVEGPANPPALAEGLAHWLGWKDALALSSALHAPAPAPTRSAPRVGARPSAPDEALAHELDRVRLALVRAITAPREASAVADVEACRRHVQSVQQAMNAAIRPLRAQARAALLRRSAAAARLSALDAVMEDVFGPREHQLLAMMPTLLERHFERLSGQDGAATPGTPAQQAVSATAPPPAWLANFRQDMQQLLLAELELRLRPVQGLLEALGRPDFP